MQKKDLIAIYYLTPDEIRMLLDRARILKNWLKENKIHKPLEGKTLGMIFHKPSTRTRVTFEVGMYQLGGQAVFLSGGEIQLGRGETVSDTAMVLSRYLNGVVIRTYKQSDIEEFAKKATIPIINGLTDSSHPCQVLSDIFTLEEKLGSVKGIKVAYVGDGNNVANSWIFGALKTGINLTIATPPKYSIDLDVVKTAEEMSKSSSGSFKIFTDPNEAVRKADVIYTDVWASMGKEDESNERKKYFTPYQVNRELLKLASKDVFVMHCLPAHRDEEISSEVMDSRNSIVFDQAENRLHLQKAILEWLME